MSRPALDMTVETDRTPKISRAEADKVLDDIAARRPDILTRSPLFDSPVDAQAALSRFIVARQRIERADVTIDDIIVWLGWLGPGVGVAVDALSRFDPTTRTAPPAALKALVIEASVPCRNPKCGELLPPWGDETCDDPDCRDAALVENGEA